VYDYFEILGVPADAGMPAIRRAESRRSAGRHPDFSQSADTTRAPGAAVTRRHPPLTPDRLDVAVDFVNMTALAPRMREAFFASSH